MDPVKIVRFFEALPHEAKTYSAAIRCDVGFWNWNKSAWICDACGYGNDNATAERNARQSYANVCASPHIPEDALMMGQTL